MKWIGLTGGIATGKSTAKKLIEGLGINIIDADLIAHQVTQKGAEGYCQVVSHFGNDVLAPDQTLDRKKLGALVFTNKELRLKLENILHPLIQREVQKLKEQYKLKQQKICFYDVPLLFEKNLQGQFDAVILVWCGRDEQLNRLMLRNHLTVEEALSRIDSQMPMSHKIKNAHHCLDNSTDLENLNIQIKHLVKSLV